MDYDIVKKIELKLNNLHPNHLMPLCPMLQPHLGKCFGNIKSLDIKTIPRHPPAVHSMMSAEGEVVHMTRSVRAKGAVEMWLSNVEAHMFETVKR